MFCVAALLGCGGTLAPQGPAPALHVSGWPPAPVGASTASEALRLLVRCTEELPPLAPPHAAPASWASRVYAPWMAARTETLENAARARRALRTQPARERAVGVGLHGAILERTASQLAEVDLSRLSEDGIDQVRSFVPGLRRLAVEAFEVCHEMGVREGIELDGWRAECDRRLESLSRRPPEPAPSTNDPDLR